jgi:hypothetical protein
LPCIIPMARVLGNDVLTTIARRDYIAGPAFIV